VQQPVLNKQRVLLGLLQPTLQSAGLQLKEEVPRSGLGPGAAETGPLADAASTEEKISSHGWSGSAATLSSFLSSSWWNFSRVLVEPGSAPHCSLSAEVGKCLQFSRLHSCRSRYMCKNW